MKDPPPERTKVVVRGLPPVLSKEALMEQIDSRFAGRYDWSCFCPGKASQKNQRFSRAYINFKRSEDVAEFAKFFHGHIFVNEKGIQFKALVEYAPSQHVPKERSKKDGREGAILKDPEYLEFLDFLAKPVEHLPSAEIQLERKEAERTAGGKEAVIVTPLMDFVRQKRAAKSRSQRSANGKLNRRVGGASPGNSISGPSNKRGSEKRRVPTTMYVQRDSVKNGARRDKVTHILVSRKDKQQTPEKNSTVASSSATKPTKDENGTLSNGANSVIGEVEPGKRKVVLLKGKESKNHQSFTSETKILHGPNYTKSKPCHDAGGQIIRGILLNKDARQSRSHFIGSQLEQPSQAMSLERENLLLHPSSRSSSIISVSDKYVDVKTAGIHQYGSVSMIDKNDKGAWKKGNPDRVWAPLRCSEGSHVADGALSLSLSDHQFPDSLEAVSISQHTAGVKVDDDFGVHTVHGGHTINLSHVTGTASSHEAGHFNVACTANGSQRNAGRHGSLHGSKEFDGAQSSLDNRTSKRIGPTGHASHDRQMWVQKSGSGS